MQTPLNLTIPDHEFHCMIKNKRWIYSAITGKGIETPTNPVIINKIKVNRKNYYVVKESKLLKK